MYEYGSILYNQRGKVLLSGCPDVVLGFHAAQGLNLYTSGFSTSSFSMLYMSNRVWTRAMPSVHGESRPNQ
jgi:hypothetical protein